MDKILGLQYSFDRSFPQTYVVTKIWNGGVAFPTNDNVIITVTTLFLKQKTILGFTAGANIYTEQVLPATIGPRPVQNISGAITIIDPIPMGFEQITFQAVDPASDISTADTTPLYFNFTENAFQFIPTQLISVSASFQIEDTILTTPAPTYIQIDCSFTIHIMPSY